jgi:hypothetical protein
MLKEKIKEIAFSQLEGLKRKDKGIPRDLLNKIDLKTPYVIVLSGVRRCGKSTLLKQLSSRLTTYHHFNFEDPRLAEFTFSDFEKLLSIFKEEFKNSKYYLFDEIQNIKKWESYVRYLQDQGNKVIITGSNASLLSKELGTKLTGRHIRHELFPFSYKEALKFLNKKPSLKTFKEYLLNGGFPEYLKYKQSEALYELFSDIITRDIIVRYNLKESKTLKELAIYLITNIGREFSYNKLKEYFKLGSVNTISSYISYLEDSYLIFTIPKFDYSYKKQIINPKKIYAIDPGLINELSASTTKDIGRILENIVFLHLRRKYKEIYYYKGKGECDFVIKEKGKITKAIQVCSHLNDNQKREISGISEASRKLKIENKLILTLDQEDKINKIKIKPVWKWLLTNP